MPYNVSHLTFELELLRICVRAQSTPHLGASTGDQIGDATLQGWEVGTQNRVKDAKKESRPIPIALVLLLAEQGRRCYFIYPPSFICPLDATQHGIKFLLFSLFPSLLISFQFGRKLTIPYKLRGKSPETGSMRFR